MEELPGKQNRDMAKIIQAACGAMVCARSVGEQVPAAPTLHISSCCCFGVVSVSVSVSVSLSDIDGIGEHIGAFSDATMCFVESFGHMEKSHVASLYSTYEP